MSRPDESLVVAANGPRATIQNKCEPVVVKCPSCRETTKAESLNSLRKNYQLVDMLKMHRQVNQFLMSELKALVKEQSKVPKSGRENIDTINDRETSNLASSVASKALTLSDLVDTWEPKLKHKDQVKAEKTD